MVKTAFKRTGGYTAPQTTVFGVDFVSVLCSSPGSRESINTLDTVSGWDSED